MKSLPQRIVYVKTRNEFKYKEYIDLFKPYGIKVIKVAPHIDTFELLRDYIDDNGDKFPVFAVMTEMSTLLNNQNHQAPKYENNEDVINYSILSVYVKTPLGSIKERIYEGSIKGKIILDQTNEGGEDIFDWDDKFVPNILDNKNLHELKLDGKKVSARQLVISRFISDYLTYSERKKLNFNNLKFDRSIDFSVSVKDFVYNNDFINNKNISKYGLKDLFNKSLNSGLFFRSAKNRREKNYWLPGLNAGIPLVAKKDPIHEITFFVHDIFHFLISDLLIVSPNNKNQFKTYMFARIMSEALTLTMADMLFIDTMNLSGINYDYSLRKIYPLLKDIKTNNPNFSDDEIMFSVLSANTKFCLLGDDSEYKKLGVSEESLTNFKSKYTAFFVEDYKWSNENYYNMLKNYNKTKLWHKWFSGITNNIITDLETVDEIMNKLGIKDDQNISDEKIVDKLLNYFYNERILNKESYDENLANKRGFIRWCLGQSYAFFDYSFVNYSNEYLDKIQELIKEIISSDILIAEQIELGREIFDEYFDRLYNDNLIKLDECETFKDVFPIFAPVYVSYDLDPNCYGNIKQVKDYLIDENL